jgi:cytochrome c peroxidase
MVRMGEIFRGASVLGVLSLAGCITEPLVDDYFTETEFKLIQTLGPLPEKAPPNPTNRFADDPQAATFGQQLFFEKSYAGKLTIADPTLGTVGDQGKINCISCHDANNYFSDARSRPNSTSLGVAWTGRNSPTLVNAAFHEWGSWAGKNDALWFDAANEPESGPNFGSNRLTYAHMIYRKYKDEYNALFDPDLDPALDPTAPDASRFPASGKPKAATAPDGAWEGMTPEDREHVMVIVANAGKSIEAYERLLISRDAPIDRYIAGDRSALTGAQKRGLNLFIGKAACIDCHAGPMLSDYKIYNTGVPQTVVATAAKEDTGRYFDIQRMITNPWTGAGKYSDDPEYGMAKLQRAPGGIELIDDVKGKFRTAPLRQIERTGPYMHNGSMLSLEDVVAFYNRGGANGGYVGTKHPAMVPLLLSAQEEADLVAFLKALTGVPVAMELTVDTSRPEPAP